MYLHLTSVIILPLFFLAPNFLYVLCLVNVFDVCLFLSAIFASFFIWNLFI